MGYKRLTFEVAPETYIFQEKMFTKLKSCEEISFLITIGLMERVKV